MKKEEPEKEIAVIKKPEKKEKSETETTIHGCNPCTCGGFIQNCPKLIISV